MKGYILSLLTLLFLISSAKGELIINEVFPTGEVEWIEIFNNGSSSIFVKNLTIFSNIYKGSYFFLGNFSISNKSFCILTNNKTKFLNIWNYSSVYEIFEGRRFLKNSNGNVSILNGSFVIDSISWNKSYSNYSIGRYPDFHKKIEEKLMPTPGEFNKKKESKKESDTSWVEVLEHSKNLRFGSLGFVKIKISRPGNFSFLVYGKRSKVVVSNNLEKITKDIRNCQSNSYLNFSTYNNSFLIVPFIVYPNCDNHYKDGLYELGLSICENGSQIKRVYFNVSIKGKISSFCPKEKIVYKKEVIREEIKPQKRQDKNCLEILEFPERVYVEEPFEIYVRYMGEKITLVYSYVYEGRNLLSKTFVKNKWIKRWDGNKVLAKEGDLLKFRLLVNDAPPGIYKLKVRAKNVCDVVKTIKILPRKKNTKIICSVTNDSIVLYFFNSSKQNFTLLLIDKNDKEVLMNVTVDENTTKREIKGKYKKSFLIVNDKRIVFCSMNVTTNTQKQRHFVKKSGESKITLTGYHSSSSPLNFFINFFDSIYRHVNSLFSSVISFFNK